MFWIRKGRGSALALPARAALSGARSRYRGIAFMLGLPDGDQMRLGLDAPVCRVRLTTWRALYEPALRGGAALGDAYVRGEVCVDGDLEDGLTGLAELGRALEDTPLGGLARVATAGPLGHRARREPSARVVVVDAASGATRGANHHDEGDRLDIACGYLRARGHAQAPEDARALDEVLARLALKPGQRLLDIGCGWGHLLLRAAERHDVEGLGLTLSEAEAAHIRAEARARRLPVKVRVMSHLDLDARAPWDRIVSLGLMSRGGRAGRGGLDRLIDKARSALAADGLCLIHCVGAARPPSADPFQQGRLFPGWWVGTLAGAASRAAARGLDVLAVRDLRRDYVATTRALRRDLLRRGLEIARSVGGDERLVRRWEFYLASLAAGLRAGHLRPLEMLMSRRDRTEDLRPREGPPPAAPRWTNGASPGRLELAGLP